MNRLRYMLIIILIVGCQSDSENSDHSVAISSDLISGVDISGYPKISSYNPTFYNYYLFKYFCSIANNIFNYCFRQSSEF